MSFIDSETSDISVTSILIPPQINKRNSSWRNKSTGFKRRNLQREQKEIKETLEENKQGSLSEFFHLIMSKRSNSADSTWSRYARQYDPIKIGSIDGTDTEPHDRAIIRALNAEYTPNKHVKGRPECTIFVSRLNFSTTKDTIKELFSKYGHIKRFRMVKDIVTGLPKGYAFIEYERESDAEEAYRNANRKNVDGKTIFVDFECERLLKGWKPRRLGGGFGGKKESGQLRFGGRDRPFKKPISLEIKERREQEKHKREYRRSRSRSRSRSSKRS